MLKIDPSLLKFTKTFFDNKNMPHNIELVLNADNVSKYDETILMNFFCAVIMDFLTITSTPHIAIDDETHVAILNVTEILKTIIKTFMPDDDTHRRINHAKR